MNDLGFGVRDRIDKAIYNKRKHVSFRFDSSVNSKAPTVIQKANRALFKALDAVRDKNAVIVSMKIDLLMTGMYTMIDFAKYTGKLHEIRAGIEKAGHLPIEGFTYKYEKAAPEKKDEWIFDVYFFEADPTDPFARSAAYVRH